MYYHYLAAFYFGVLSFLAAGMTHANYRIFTNSALTAGEITEFYEYQYKDRTFSVSVYDDGGKPRVVIM